MKASISLFSTLLGMSQAYAIRRTDTSTSAYLQITSTSNSTLDGYYGYVDPNIVADNGVVFQLTPSQSSATNFSITSDGYLSGYKTGYVAGSTNAEGTATGDAIYMSALDLYEQGGEPIVSVAVDDDGVVALSDSLGDGTVRDLPQACFLDDVGSEDTSLQVLVLGEEYFDACASITIYWVPV